MKKIHQTILVAILSLLCTSTNASHAPTSLSVLSLLHQQLQENMTKDAQKEHEHIFEEQHQRIETISRFRFQETSLKDWIAYAHEKSMVFITQFSNKDLIQKDIVLLKNAWESLAELAQKLVSSNEQEEKLLEEIKAFNQALVTILLQEKNFPEMSRSDLRKKKLKDTAIVTSVILLTPVFMILVGEAYDRLFYYFNHDSYDYSSPHIDNKEEPRKKEISFLKKGDLREQAFKVDSNIIDNNEEKLIQDKEEPIKKEISFLKEGASREQAFKVETRDVLFLVPRRLIEQSPVLSASVNSQFMESESHELNFFQEDYSGIVNVLFKLLEKVANLKEKLEPGNDETIIEQLSEFVAQKAKTYFAWSEKNYSRYCNTNNDNEFKNLLEVLDKICESCLAKIYIRGMIKKFKSRKLQYKIRAIYYEVPVKYYGLRKMIENEFEHVCREKLFYSVSQALENDISFYKRERANRYSNDNVEYHVQLYNNINDFTGLSSRLMPNTEKIISIQYVNQYKYDEHDHFLTSIHSRVFANYSNLKTLNLNNGTLQTIDADAFVGLEKLEKIDLSKNRHLQKLPENLFAPCKNIKKISLKRCCIQDDAIDGLIKVLEGLQSLQRVDLRCNPLSKEAQNLLEEEVNKERDIPIAFIFD